jgi:thiamine-phosphate diphosphorylase
MTQRRVRGVYAIIDPDACYGRTPADIARMALDGGACVVQWRDKRRPKGTQLGDVAEIAVLCRKSSVPLIMNDDADLAVAAAADGVHVGQHDLPASVARRILGAAAIIGVSTNTVDEAIAAVDAGADYVAVGAMFPTRSKDDTRPAGITRLREIRAAVRVPVVAIGGIDADNASQVIDAGADAIAVISAICGAEDPRRATAALAGLFGQVV